MSNPLHRIIHKIRNCINYRNLVALEKPFNDIGLTIHPTAKNWFILCKIIDNKPCATSVVDDFIFLISMDRIEDEISDRALDCIVDFVQNNADKPSEVLDIAKTWRNGIRTYGEAICIINEDVERVSQNMTLFG